MIQFIDRTTSIDIRLTGIHAKVLRELSNAQSIPLAEVIYEVMGNLVPLTSDEYHEFLNNTPDKDKP
ncbi:Uncharacterised protein [uncultured archaeon]|nr:Uncharacterised protein [uncultured archaeon]